MMENVAGTFGVVAPVDDLPLGQYQISKQCQGSSTLFVETNCFFNSWHLCRVKTLGHVVFLHQLVWNSKLYIYIQLRLNN